MIVLQHYIGADTCPVYVPQHDEDIPDFLQFIRDNQHEILAVDTETTGLDIFAASHRLRLVQFGTEHEAWVLRADKFLPVIKQVLEGSLNFVFHNAPYDLLVIEKHVGVPVEKLAPKSWDTRLMAHLQDPRGREEGGIGLVLGDLCAHYLHIESKQNWQTELYKVFHQYGWTKKTGWARIDIEHLVYLMYASNDVLIDARLYAFLKKVTSGMSGLCAFEHKLQYLLTLLRRKGMRIDRPYTERLAAELHNEWVEFCDRAFELGVDSVNSTAQVIAKLQEMGETLTEVTGKGALKVDRAVLLPLADLNDRWQRIEAREPNMLADAVIRAKRALKWLETYAESALRLCDLDGRIHPVINSLQARTARMSVSEWPAQQLPSSDWRVRRIIIPDEGMAIIAADLKAVEMRVLAALSGDWTMKDAIRQGKDLHDFTAERVFGKGFTPRERKIAKSIGFGKVYGGGAATISRQTGAPQEAVKVALKAYDDTFPGIRRYARELAKNAQDGLMEVVTPIGRRLPLDEDRIYAATNYMVQSTARDLLAKAVVECFRQGLGDYLLVPVHDELVGQAPVAEAREIVDAIGKCMESNFKGVEILSSPEVYGPSWGAGYKAPADLSLEPIERKARKTVGGWQQEELDIFSL